MFPAESKYIQSRVCHLLGRVVCLPVAMDILPLHGHYQIQLGVGGELSVQYSYVLNNLPVLSDTVMLGFFRGMLAFSGGISHSLPPSPSPPLPPSHSHTYYAQAKNEDVHVIVCCIGDIILASYLGVPMFFT